MSNFLGSLHSEQRVYSLALTSSDEVVLSGWTTSADFPVTPGAFDTVYNPGEGSSLDGYIARLSADGTDLHWGTYLGGDGYDNVAAVALIANDEVVAAGTFSSPDFPAGGGFAARLVMEADSEVEPTPDPALNRYSISGRLVDEDGNAIVAAVVSYGSKFVTTNLSGYFTITGLITGTYTLTPSSVLYRFEPLAKTVTVPPGATNQNFTGISPTPLPVVLVHGWNDTAATWDTYLEEFLPSIGREGHAIASMYTGYGGVIPYSIDKNARKLADYIAFVKRETGAKQVDIVAHSMGGLISRRYIAKYMDANAPDVNQLIMLGTPNMGSLTSVVNQLGFYLGTRFNPLSTELTPLSVLQFNADNFDRRGVPFYAVAGNYRCDTKSPKSNPLEEPDPDDVVVSRMSVFAIPLQGRWTYPSAQLSGCEGDHRGMRSNGVNEGGQQIFDRFVSPLLQGQMPAIPSESVALFSNQTEVSMAGPAQTENTAIQFTSVQSGTLDAGGRVEFSQSLEPTASAGFTVIAPPNQVVVSLRDPNGQVIAPNTTDPNVQFMQMDPEFMPITSYVISTPNPGIWTTIVEATLETPTEGVVVAAVGSMSSDLQLTLPVAENGAAINRPVQIAARLQSSTTPVLGASVSAQLVSPDGLVTLIALADDGLHGDGGLDDGLYGYQFIPTTPGVYSALISAEGVNGDTHFERSTVWAIQVDGNQIFLPLTLR